MGVHMTESLRKAAFGIRAQSGPTQRAVDMVSAAADHAGVRKQLLCALHCTAQHASNWQLLATWPFLISQGLWRSRRCSGSVTCIYIAQHISTGLCQWQRQGCAGRLVFPPTSPAMQLPCPAAQVHACLCTSRLIAQVMAQKAP